MRVHFDDQIVMHQPRGGVSRYFVELIEAFRRDRDLHVAVDVDWRASRNIHAVEAGLGRSTSRSRRRLHRFARRLPSMPERRSDIYHPTYYYPDRLPTMAGPPMVVTVHDMIPELLPGFWPHGNPHLAKEDWVRRADGIVCISESTRRDLLRIYGPLEAFIAVVPMGVSDDFTPGGTAAHRIPGDYLLFLGHRANYKDFAVAAEAFAGIRAEYPGLNLVAVGGGRFTESERSNLRRLGIDGLIHQVDASDPELAALFASSRAFLFPSRYEGFGLPTLEAMACGAPVILAESSSHPEVGGDAALYFAPGDAASLSSQVRRVLDDTALRDSLVARGFARAATFTWHETATRTRDVYAKVMRRGV